MALAIQCWTRGNLSRARTRQLGLEARLSREMVAAVRIQQLCRMFLGKMLVQDLRIFLQEDIFAQTRLGNLQLVEDLYEGYGTDVKYGVDSRDANGNTLLMIAAKFGHKRIVRKCLKWGMEVNTTNAVGEGPALLAIRRLHDDLAEYLIEKGAETTVFAHFAKTTLLHEAAAVGAVGCVSSLLHGLLDPNTVNDRGQTALHTAAGHGQVASAELLLERGVRVNDKDEEGKSPLHMAASAGFVEVAEVLLAAGANVGAKDNENRTPWGVAVDCSQEQVARVLRARWMTDVGDLSTLSEHEAWLLVNSVSSVEREAALAAINADDAVELATLLDDGLPVDAPAEDPNIPDTDDKLTLLHIAARSGKLQCVELLLQRNADINRQTVRFT